MLPLNGPESREKDFRILVRFIEQISVRGQGLKSQGTGFRSKVDSARIEIKIGYWENLCRCQLRFPWFLLVRVSEVCSSIQVLHGNGTQKGLCSSTQGPTSLPCSELADGIFQLIQEFWMPDC